MKLSPILLSGALAVAMSLPIVGCAQQTSAQSPATSHVSGHNHHRGMMRMFRGINLSDQQKTQIQQIMQQYRQAHPEGSQPDPDARKAMRQQLMSVLTPDQQAQVKANLQKMRAERNGQRPNETPNSGNGNVFPAQPAPQSTPN